MSTLTHEQQRVVDSKAKLLAVDAFAGSGKTSTLVAYAGARMDARILPELNWSSQHCCVRPSVAVH